MASAPEPTRGKKRLRVTVAQLRGVANQWAAGSSNEEDADTRGDAERRAVMVLTFGRSSGVYSAPTRGLGRRSDEQEMRLFPEGFLFAFSRAILAVLRECEVAGWCHTPFHSHLPSSSTSAIGICPSALLRLSSPLLSLEHQRGNSSQQFRFDSTLHRRSHFRLWCPTHAPRRSFDAICGPGSRKDAGAHVRRGRRCQVRSSRWFRHTRRHTRRLVRGRGWESVHEGREGQPTLIRRNRMRRTLADSLLALLWRPPVRLRCYLSPRDQVQK